jgi:hypothetical protein
MATQTDATNYNWSTYPHSLYGGEPRQGVRKLTKEAYVKKVQDLLEECRRPMDDLRETSMKRPLTERELETAFDLLYDAADLLKRYRKDMKATKDDATLQANEDGWVRGYMKDLILYGIGTTAEIRLMRDEPLATLSGRPMRGDVIQVRMLDRSRRNDDVPLFNWLEVDEFFWDQDYIRAEYEYNEEGNLPYDTTRITRD